MSEFEKLLAELNSAAEQTSTLAKSLPADDSQDDGNIQAAAGDGGDANDQNPEDADGGADADDKGGDTMAKSMTIDGEEVQVLDGEEFMKSLNAVGDRMTATEQVLAKALQSVTVTINQQNELIKSMGAQIEKFAGQGRGRKTVLAIHEPKGPTDTLAKSQPQGPAPHEIMAKALSAQASGKLTGLEVARVESNLNAGLGVPADVLAKLN